MWRVTALLVAAIAVLVVGPLQAAEQPALVSDPAVMKKLHELGYPADAQAAIQRWRTDNGRTATGPLGVDEAAALLAQRQPEFMAAIAGNPFTGMGVAMRHETRAAAEREAIEICKDEGGGAACVGPAVVRAEQCVVIVGYSVTIDRRPTYRVSVAISTDSSRAMEHAKEACQNGATHPAQCRPLLRFCGDGREVTLFDGKGEADTKTAAVR